MRLPLLPLLALGLAFGLGACAPKQEVVDENDASPYRTSTADQKKIAQQFPGLQPRASGLISITRKEGSGPGIPKRGVLVGVNYEVRLLDGTLIDKQDNPREPFVIPVGVGRLIKGCDEALMEMKVGEKRTLVIPHYIGYGVTGNPPKVPPYSTLLFDIELLEIK